MKLTTNKLLFIATAIIMLFMVVSTYQYNLIKDYQRLIESIDTTTTVKHDTVYNTQVITDTVPKLKYKYVYKRDTLYKDSVPHLITLENKTYQDTLITNEDTISYQAHVSGYNMDEQNYPRLDSINLHRTFKTITVYQETIIEKKTPQNVRKWHLSPSVGIGYGLTQKQFDAYLGISLGYDILK